MLDKIKKYKFAFSCIFLFIAIFSISQFGYLSKFTPIEKATIEDIQHTCNDIGPEIATDIVVYVKKNNIKDANELYDYKHNKTIIQGLGPKRFKELKRYFK